MSVRSPYSAYVRIPVPTTPQPFDASTAAALANNASFIADARAQVRVKYLAGSGGRPYPPVPASEYATASQVIFAARFSVALHASGEPYSLRVRIAGASDGVHSIQFRVIIAPGNVGAFPWAGAFAGTVTTGDAVFLTSAITSGSAAWLTGASQGPAASPTLLTIPSTWAVDRPWATRQQDATTPLNDTLPQPSLTVLVRATTQAYAKLYGLVIEENA